MVGHLSITVYGVNSVFLQINRHKLAWTLQAVGVQWRIWELHALRKNPHSSDTAVTIYIPVTTNNF
jgi:hypothetical protein